MIKYIILAFIAAGVIGCGDSGPVKPSKHITVDNFTGGSWPFTFWGGNIKCQARNGVAIKSETGVVYGLNGAGQGELLTAESAVWKDNPEIPGTKVSLGPVINHALKACGYLRD